jgi:hypothetical protein
MKRWLSSPLAGTAGVVAGLVLISFPLRKLTSAAPVASPVEVAVATEKTDAVLRLKLLASAERVVVRDTDGRVLLETRDVPAGESEHDASIDLTEDGVELELAIEGTRADGETAAFLSVMPDGREELTRYATGAGDFGDILRFEWPHEH